MTSDWRSCFIKIQHIFYPRPWNRLRLRLFCNHVNHYHHHPIIHHHHHHLQVEVPSLGGRLSGHLWSCGRQARFPQLSGGSKGTGYFNPWLLWCSEVRKWLDFITVRSNSDSIHIPDKSKQWLNLGQKMRTVQKEEHSENIQAVPP